jgi:hypothetical protein
MQMSRCRRRITSTPDTSEFEFFRHHLVVTITDTGNLRFREQSGDKLRIVARNLFLIFLGAITDCKGVPCEYLFDIKRIASTWQTPSSSLNHVAK